MKRAFFLGGLLLLAGCGGWPFSRPYAAYDAPADSLRGQCERAAYDDPLVKQQVAESATQVGNSQASALQQLEAVKRAAIQRCMARRGGAQRVGGVELPQ